jgi:sugar-specific transcriptional regulator TrmB
MSTRVVEPRTGALVALGFTELQAEIYLHLVEASPATGYAIAKAIGRPVANTYKAVESLWQKGAVLVDETSDASARVCRAVPGAELLRALESDFRRHQRAAAATLKRLKPARGDDGVYTLASVEQVVERCDAMVRRARDVVLADAFPEALSWVEAPLAAAARRGVHVAVKTYAPVSSSGIDAVVLAGGDKVLERWPGQWLNVVVDGREFLLSYSSVDGTELHQALWSRSPYVSWAYHSALTSEIGEARLVEALDRNATKAELRRVLAANQMLRTAATGADGQRRVAPRR